MSDDVMAREWARTQIAEAMTDVLAAGVRTGGRGGRSDQLAAQPANVEPFVREVNELFAEARFERAENEHGARVRRVVLVGRWEHDPDPVRRRDCPLCRKPIAADNFNRHVGENHA